MVDTLPDRTGLREVLGSFVTGVTVITTEHDGELHGMTANSFTSVSLEPPLVLVCFARSSRTSVAVAARGEFVVNLLDQHQAAVSHRFARPADDHFAGARIRRDERGLPILADGLGHLACSVHEIYPGGDHDIVIGRVRHAATAMGAPLVFFRGGYCKLAEDMFEPERCWYA